LYLKLMKKQKKPALKSLPLILLKWRKQNLVLKYLN